MRHANISIFVPHIGCPNQCVFCNQRSISGAQKAPERQDVIDACKVAKASLGENSHIAEIAFFGGSFTAIDKGYMTALLETAADCVKTMGFGGIRCSTRPDAIDDEIIKTLTYYGVTAVELGVQTMNDEVLCLNKRGHTTADVYRACELLRKTDISLGLQMMAGLYGDTPENVIKTAELFCKIHPDTVRIYPTLVMGGTELEALYNKGSYTPLTLDEAVKLCAQCLDMFNKAGIAVIRLGLHSSESVQAGMVAGPFHPAFRELCESQLLLDKLTAEITEKNMPKGAVTVEVNPKWVSRLIGQGKKNVEILRNLQYNLNVVQNTDVPEGEARLVI